MTSTWRIAWICILTLVGLAASSVLGGCANDVPTPPWLPNYTASGYGGKGGSAGKAGGTSVGAAGEAGETGDSSAGGSSGEAGDGP